MCKKCKKKVTERFIAWMRNICFLESDSKLQGKTGSHVKSKYFYSTRNMTAKSTVEQIGNILHDLK